jgi:hypothetical protein
MPVVAISDSQREPLRMANWIATVYDRIDLAAHPFGPRDGDCLAFLGRITPDEGLDRAIGIARQAWLLTKIEARMPLENSGTLTTPSDWEDYRAVIEPLFREPDVEYIGEVGDTDRYHCLGNALALLFPIDWPEPFGLVMAESLACGTPVVARRRGSVPEVVDDGVTDLIGEMDADLERLCGRVGDLDRAACRAAAKQRFSASAITDGYERGLRQAAPGQGERASPWCRRPCLRLGDRDSERHRSCTEVYGESGTPGALQTSKGTGMANRQRTTKIQPGDRVIDRLNGRVGTVNQIVEAVDSRQVAVAYDAAPQDEFLGTSATHGAQRPEALFERER